MLLRTFLCLFFFGCSSFSTAVEIMHWWTSAGEQRALQTLEQHLKQHQIEIEINPILGGGGDNAMTVLQARALAGNPPQLAQIEGPSIRDWDAIGILHNLNPVAAAEHWDEKLYPAVIHVNKTEQGYVALPLTLHRMNMLWVNNRLLKQLNLQLPTTQAEFLQALKTAHQHGISPLAIGEQPWQIAQIFESFVIAYGGIDFYRQSLVELSPEHIRTPPMHQALQALREVSQWVSFTKNDERWDSATQALINGETLFQLGGDWILGELLAKKVKVPEAISCTPAPGSHNSYLYNMDSFVFMASKEFSYAEANQLATLLADKQFQTNFNRYKGSIPVRQDIALDTFNLCQQRSHQDFLYAAKEGNLVPSMTDSMAVNPMIQQAITNEIFHFFRNPAVSEEEVMKRIWAIASSN
ncbi:carbohydrate ABC transporter substrate-binding protein [Vibrio mimicus]